MISELISKYNVSGPRYTSYPTAPEWTTEFDDSAYRQALHDFHVSGEPLSVYVHVPFCESQCYFCGCNVAIRKPHEKFGDEYLDYLEREVEMVGSCLETRPHVLQCHLGGGTPNFLTNDQMSRLMAILAKRFILADDAEVSIEVDPRVITQDKLRHLRALGFNRLSMGVQDFNERVQNAINRVQPYDMVADVFKWARALNFVSVNIDLIYGLPYQTVESFSDTIGLVNQLQPDRIALYSYAHVPWLKSHQKLMPEQEMADSDAKLALFLAARDGLEAAGYMSIAMDHFALPTDEMAVAFQDGSLYRNFMGYTLKPADDFVGLGVSSIGYLRGRFSQNKKGLKAYYADIDAGELPVDRGKVLVEDDLIRRWVILALMCRYEVNFDEFESKFGRLFVDYFESEIKDLEGLVLDGLLRVEADRLFVTEVGRLFVRNICMVFDAYLKKPEGHQRFSKTI